MPDNADKNSLDGFYTRSEAAEVLGVSVRQVDNHLRDGLLTRTMIRNRVYIHRTEVENLYYRKSNKRLPKDSAAEGMERRMAAIEQQLEILKLGMGFGSRREPRNETEMLVVHAKLQAALVSKEWSVKFISYVADELKTITEEEVKALISELGTDSLITFVDLSQRMLTYLETSPKYYTNQYEVLARRLRDARNRFYGMLFAATKIEGLVAPVKQAERAFTQLHIKSTTIDRFVSDFIINS